MGLKRGTYVGETHQGICLGSLRERDHLEVQGIDGRIILKQPKLYIWIISFVCKYQNYL
jgi:hypothetical protein